MYSKEEAAKLRQDFWTSFGKSFPRKWVLYKTGVKPVQFRFYFDTKKAMVCIDIEGNEEERDKYFNKMLSVRSILNDFLPDSSFEKHYLLENGKEISRIWLEKQSVSIHDKKTGQATMEFFNENMQRIELFWQGYKDFFKEEV